MSGNNMVFSMVFKVIDAATAPIKALTNALGEPAKAAEQVGDAGENATKRLGTGMERARATVRRLGEAFRHPIERIAEFTRAAGEASEKFGRSFAGIGALVAEGLSVKEVAGEEEYWKRIQLNFNLTGAAVHRLREDLDGAAVEFGVTRSTMAQAFQAFQAMGGSAEAGAENARTLAAVLQLTGASAENVGGLFATLETKMHLTSAKDMAATVATLRQQFIGVAGGIDAFSEAIPRMADDIDRLGIKGGQAAVSLGAVFAVAAKGAGGNARKAITATETWLHDLTFNKGYQASLSQGLGETVLDANGWVKDPRWIMRKAAERYAQAMALPKDQQAPMIYQLDQLFGESMSKMFKTVGGEIKTTGHSATMEQVLGAKGDPAELMGKAAEAGKTLTAAMNRMKDSMAIAAESVFTGPIEVFTDALDACGGVVGKVVLGLAALAAVGHAITWVSGAVAGFRLLAATLGAIRLGSLVAGLGSVAAGIVPVVAGFGAWAAAVLANPVTWIVLGVVAAVAAVGVAIWQLYKEWDTIWAAISGTVTAAIRPVVKLGAGIKDSLGGAWDWVADKVTKVIDWCTQKLDALLDRIQRAKDWLGEKTRPAREAVNGAAHWVGHAAHQLSGAVAGKAQGAMGWFQAHGWTRGQAAGLAAGFARESAFNPGAVGDNGRAYGIGQWHPDRQAEFRRWAGHDIRGSTLEEQLGFAQYELTEGKEQAAGRALAAANTPAEAGAVVSERYERPADVMGEASRRAADAQSLAASAPRPLSAGSPASASVKPEGTITVRFDNLPPGARPQVESRSPGLALELDRGPLMAAG